MSGISHTNSFGFSAKHARLISAADLISSQTFGFLEQLLSSLKSCVITISGNFSRFQLEADKPAAADAVQVLIAANLEQKLLITRNTSNDSLYKYSLFYMQITLN